MKTQLFYPMEMTTQNRYSLWLVPEGHSYREVQFIIGNLARQYDAPEFPPHCTLWGSLTEDAVASVKSWLENYEGKPLPFTVTTIAHSDYFWKTLYLQLDHSSELAHLFRRFAQQASVTSNYEFNPHISLLYHKIPQPDLEALSRRIVVPATGYFNSIALFSTGDTIKSWQLIYEKKLD